jgi:hypothetical protein
VAFYKDRGGVVHLKGVASGGVAATVIFFLPPGYRPASGKTLDFPAVCGCSTTDTPAGDTVKLPTGVVEIVGPGVNTGTDGEVELLTGGSSYVSIEGITFRPGS